MTACADCGRPIAEDACTGCQRSKRGGWAMVRPVLGNGQGGPGMSRGSPTGRPYQLSFKLDPILADKLRAIAAENGHALGRIVRDLIEDGLRYRRGASARTEPDAEHLARRREFSKVGTEPQRAPERLRPVMPGDAGGGCFDDR